MDSEILDANFNKPVDIVAIVKRYALILSILLAIQVIVRVGMPYYLQNMFSMKEYSYIIYLLPSSYFVFNIIAAAIVYGDMKKFDLMSKSILALTLVNDDIGICFFLIL